MTSRDAMQGIELNALGREARALREAAAMTRAN
jgi:hypothetical protein